MAKAVACAHEPEPPGVTFAGLCRVLPSGLADPWPRKEIDLLMAKAMSR